MFLLTFHYNFENHCSQNLIRLPMFDELVITILETTLDVVYVPVNFSLRFSEPQFSKSYTTYVTVYVPMNLSLRFCVPPVHKISCDFTHALHVVSDF